MMQTREDVKPVRRYEDNAEPATETGFRCKHYKRFWSDRSEGNRAEHMARWCCSNDRPCECGGRITDGSWTCCKACRAKKDEERFQKLPRVEWAGMCPLMQWDNDRLFMTAEDVAEYCAENGLHPNELRLVLAEPNNGHHFEMNDFLQDDLAPDQSVESDGIDAIVNEWIDSQAPFSWSATNKVVTPESVLAHIGEVDWEVTSGYEE